MELLESLAGLRLTERDADRIRAVAFSLVARGGVDGACKLRDWLAEEGFIEHAKSIDELIKLKMGKKRRFF